jgi:hypothetical protein
MPESTGGRRTDGKNFAGGWRNRIARLASRQGHNSFNLVNDLNLNGTKSALAQGPSRIGGSVRMRRSVRLMKLASVIPT